MSTIRHLLFVALVLALALAAGACDDDESSSATTTATTSSAGSASDADGSAAATTTTTMNEEFSGDGGSDWCDKVRALEEDNTFLDIYNKSPQEIEAEFEEAADLYDELKREVPRVIEDDFDLLMDAFNEWHEWARDLDFNWSTMEADESGPDIFDDPEVEAAGERIDAHDRDVCGIDVG